MIYLFTNQHQLIYMFLESANNFWYFAIYANTGQTNKTCNAGSPCWICTLGFSFLPYLGFFKSNQIFVSDMKMLRYCKSQNLTVKNSTNWTICQFPKYSKTHLKVLLYFARILLSLNNMIWSSRELILLINEW
jgi:hypothetical protein